MRTRHSSREFQAAYTAKMLLEVDVSQEVQHHPKIGHRKRDKKSTCQNLATHGAGSTASIVLHSRLLEDLHQPLLWFPGQLLGYGLCYGRHLHHQGGDILVKGTGRELAPVDACERPENPWDQFLAGKQRMVASDEIDELRRRGRDL